jgi:hypothetical protein
MRLLKRIIRWLFSLLRWLFLLALMLFALQYSTIPVGLQWNAVGLIVGERQFDYVGWELDALAVKMGETLYGLHPFMNEADRTPYIRQYMADLGKAESIDAQITQLFTDPNTPDPQADPGHDQPAPTSR